MRLLKTVIKIIGALGAGILIGLLIAALLVILFTDTSLSEFASKFSDIKIGEILLSGGVGLLAGVISLFILIISHEAGHLIAGIMSGYDFVSFRIFNLTFIKEEGRLRIKRYSIAGTGGQCLLSPPDRPIEDIPTGWYNFGGVFVNIIEIITAGLFLAHTSNPFLAESLVIFILIGSFLVIINGIPMKISGAGNDAYNMMALKKNILARKGLVNALKINALTQKGVRLKDMPDSWFETDEEVDYSNQLEVSIPLSAASREADRLNFSKALEAFETIYRHRKSIIPLYVKEIECELIFLRLACGEEDKGKELLSDDLKKYIQVYSKVMSSKKRILCAIALYIEKDRGRAIEIYENVRLHEKDYLLQGEVRSDIELMREILDDKERALNSTAYDQRG